MPQRKSSGEAGSPGGDMVVSVSHRGRPGQVPLPR